MRQMGVFVAPFFRLSEAPMSAPTKLISPHLVDELHRVLARLRTARTVDPKHAEPIGKMTPHVKCDICTAEARLNYLIDQIPRMKP